MLEHKPEMTRGPATDHNTAVVARPLDTTTAQDEDARANINVVLSTAARQQQHGQHQLMSTLPPGPVTTTPGQTSKRSEDILLLADQVLASYHLFILIVI